jgi:hypothetical protein
MEQGVAPEQLPCRIDDELYLNNKHFVAHPEERELEFVGDDNDPRNLAFIEMR